MREKIPVAVLGSTGSVGQRFVQLVSQHPWFELVAVTGSERRLGQKFGESCHWVLTEPMPKAVQEMEIVPSHPDQVQAPLVFSALPSKVAAEVEPIFASAGKAVCTNAGAFRREPDVPILLPEINPGHTGLIETQQRNRGWKGFIVTNPNCTSTGATITLKALSEAFGVRKAFMFSMQAVSGAGYPGVASLDIMDNVIPYIPNEEEKLEWEPRKMLGTLENGSLKLAGLALSTHTNRVSVSDGHMVCLSVELESPVDPETAMEALAAYRPPQASRELPSTPTPVIEVQRRPDRPQPRLDRLSGRGMTTVVGRVRNDPILHLKMVVLSHNTIRGAAGGSIYNAELLISLGKIGS